MVDRGCEVYSAEQIFSAFEGDPDGLEVVALLVLHLSTHGAIARQEESVAQPPLNSP